jgi:DNA invertase Pin-like site-specific DNA recombinase
MLADIAGGSIDAVACWHVDRLTRSPRELEDVIDLADRHGVELATVTGEIDLATPTGRMIARMLGAAARHEAEHKAERQKRQRRQNAEDGKVSGGGMRPFGYADDRVTIIDDEAEVIREAARRLLAGESQSSICRDLAARGIRTPNDGTWIPTTLRRLMASARISGRREHSPRSSSETTRPLLGEIVADAIWPGIISVQDSDKIRALLSDPDRARKYSTATGRSYLLSGILRCGKPKGDGKPCGWGMVGRPKSGVPRYVCPNTPGRDSCGGTATVAARTDRHVRDMVLTALDSPAMRKRLNKETRQDTGLSEAIREDEELLEQFAIDLATRKMKRPEWIAARSVVDARLEANYAKLAKQTGASVLAGFLGTYEDMLARWESPGMNTSQRRAIVGAVVRGILVLPATKKWDPDRFDFDWIA